MRKDDPDLEVDMMASNAIRTAVADDSFAQALYAALCNADWRKEGHAGEPWSASWRRAGDIVADLRNRGEIYLDFYCSGIGNPNGTAEGVVRSDVAEALARLGWHPQPIG